MTTEPLVRDKVFAYVTCGERLLVFTERDFEKYGLNNHPLNSEEILFDVTLTPLNPDSKRKE
ncbi:MAG: hypothetical protein RTU30_11540 [Candidatus Thorarchaeota archaeon]